MRITNRMITVQEGLVINVRKKEERREGEGDGEEGGEGEGEGEGEERRMDWMLVILATRSRDQETKSSQYLISTNGWEWWCIPGIPRYYGETQTGGCGPGWSGIK
jgi:hypothetical protein